MGSAQVTPHRGKGGKERAGNAPARGPSRAGDGGGSQRGHSGHGNGHSQAGGTGGNPVQPGSPDWAVMPEAEEARVEVGSGHLPPGRYLDREESWLRFNQRVLELAEDETVPLLERARFVAIFASNLDEFFMVRVAGRIRRMAAGLPVESAIGVPPEQVLENTLNTAGELARRHAACFSDSVRPALAAADIEILRWKQLAAAEQGVLHQLFRERIFPVLTPLVVDPAHPFPYISGLSLSLAVMIAFVALLVGGVLIAAGLFRLGWISEFLSTPVITGVLAGIAVEIVVRQIPVILGVSGGGTTTVDRIGQVAGQLGHINGWSVGIAAGVLAIIAAAQRISHRLPGTLLALILSIVAVDTLGLASHHGVAILGAVHGGLPHVRLPPVSWSQVRRMPGLVLTVAFVCIAQTAATVRQQGAEAPAASTVNRDLIGIGAGSVAAGLIGAFPVDASPPNTAIATASGTRSQLANTIAALVVLAVVLAATAPLTDLPAAMLAAMLVYIASSSAR